jgi:large subunit ribosomal protein LP0
MPNAAKLAKKQIYFDKLVDLCVNTPKALIVSADHVASKQMQNIRMDLRGKAVVLFGKNTMIRKALQLGAETHPDAGLETLRGAMKGNLGFIFATNCELDDIRATLDKFVLNSAAKAGQDSMVNLDLPAGPTGMDPSQTSFFQTLNIATKIVKGQIELISAFPMLKIGEKVSAGAAQLLNKLGNTPFSYKMEVQMVFQNGGVFSAAVLDISDAVLISKFLAGVNNMAALSREIGIPTEAALPHAFGNAFKNVAALLADVAFTFKEVEEVKKFFENPDAYAAANPGGGGGGGGGAAAPAKGGAAPAKAAAAVEEEEEEDGGDFDLFG